MALSACNTVTDEHGRELTVHGTPLFPVASYLDDLVIDEVPWHWHEELEVSVVESGTAVFSVDGERRMLEAGSGYFVNSGVLHGAWEAATGAGRMHATVFHPRLVGGSLDSIFWQGYVQPLLSDASCRCVCFDPQVPWQRQALSAMEEAWQACKEEPPGYEFAVRQALSTVIFLLVQNCPPAQKVPSEKSLRDARRMKAMLQYIQEHYSEPVTAADIARSAAVSESECLRCFRAVIGAAPIQYVKQLRLQKAAELLQFTDRKIADIGGACGFQEMSYFAKAFRELKGCTPSECRRRRQQEDRQE